MDNQQTPAPKEGADESTLDAPDAPNPSGAPDTPGTAETSGTLDAPGSPVDKAGNASPEKQENTSAAEDAVLPATAPPDIAIANSTATSKTRKVARRLKAGVIAISQTPSFAMVMSTFLFSVMLLCVKMASDYYSSFEIISFRGVVGVAGLLVYYQLAHGHGLSAMKTKYFGMQMWRSFIGTMSMVAWFYGVAYLSLSTATVISYMSSIWMAIFIIAAAMITGKNKPDLRLLIAVIVGFGGIVLILRPSGGSFETTAWPSFAVLLSSVFTALAYLQVAALGRVGEPEYRTVFYFCAFGAVFGLVCTLLSPSGFSPFSWKGMLWMVPVGITAMIAQLCLTRAYSKGNALVNASLQYLGLVFVILFDWLLGLGLPDSLAFIGMAMVVASGLLATLLRSIQIPHVIKHADKHHH